ncbi:Long-chain acyl-CoA thioesterase FadM [Planctomycetes bacterium CA13]|uniref:Long-chain acyl-CoA thioesterase FadM n=1 Tax=Novipirellula herctigrandis TaxID=2527986 RepID=A0A5C5Z526_9BACT|nr:Long-chain acyl-CoA thioesterase FadM [Planctomycetes bacterium CA13]
MLSFFDLSHTVDPNEIDSQQHVHNLRYLQWTLWAAGKHSAAIGWDAKEAAAEGLGWVVRQHEITYRAAAFANDELIVRTWVSQIQRYASTRKTLICRPADNAVLAKVQTRWVYVDLRNHKVIEIPDDVREKMAISKTPALPWH